MRAKAWIELLTVFGLVAVVSISTSMAFGGAPLTSRVVPILRACCLFATAATAVFYRLRAAYPPIVGWVAVVALLSLPRVFAIVIAAPPELLGFSLVLITWGLWPIIRFGIVGVASWLLVGGCATALVRVELGLPFQQWLQIPEWHWALVIIGVVAIIRRSRQDHQGVCLCVSSLVVALVVQGVVKQAMLVPLVGIAAGRLVYRGTLISPIRIPPATWAIVLLAIATIRSTVIMTTWAPRWDEYQNRIGLLIEPAK